MSNKIFGARLVKGIAITMLWLMIITLVFGLIITGILYTLGFQRIPIIKTLGFIKIAWYYLMFSLAFIGGIQIIYLLFRNKRKIIKIIKQQPSIAFIRDGENDV